jgi:hypothetical protein
MNEVRLEMETVTKQTPAWLVALILAVWEVIKNELDAYIQRLRR